MADKCPVDHEAREAYMKNGGSNPHASADKCPVPHDKPAADKCPVPHAEATEDKCPVDHDARAQWLKMGAQAPHDIETTGVPNAVVSPDSLSVDREVSSIPRTGHEGNWMYPSQKQFFEAMMRKNHNPVASDMSSVVPIHNSVNERAWNFIQQWENGYGGEACGGIKLTSFKGDSKKLTPRAWIRSALLGYTKPFDRHDWIVNRCGKEIEYVIDFYGDENSKGQASFYMDVRPKLNTFEGCKMRFLKVIGL